MEDKKEERKAKRQARNLKGKKGSHNAKRKRLTSLWTQRRLMWTSKEMLMEMLM